MHHLARRDHGLAQRGRGAGVELGEGQRERVADLGRAREHQLHGRHQARLDAGRPGDHERSLALAHVPGFEQQEDEPGVVVAVQMGQRDGADRSRIDAEALHREQPGGAAVDQQSRRAARQQERRVQAAAATHGVAAPEDMELHWTPWARAP